MSNRSGTTYSSPTDADRRAVILGASTADGITPLPLEISPTTGKTAVYVPAMLQKDYDYVAMTNADGNGNYQTFTYRLGGAGGTVQNILTFTYDVNSNVTSITRT